MKRLEEEDRIRRESAAARQLAAARKLEEETVTVAVVDAPPNEPEIVAPIRPTDRQLVNTIASAYYIDYETALEWLTSFGLYPDAPQVDF
jgi:hypothetical protein